MTLEKFAEEIFKYLESKVPDMEQHTIAEIAEHITFKVANFTSDAVWEQVKAWKAEQRKAASRMRGNDNG